MPAQPPTPGPAPPTPRASGTLILGIDPGSSATGYGLLRLDGSRVHYVRSGVFAPKRTLPFPDRLAAVYDGLLALLDEVQPEEVAVESAFVRKSAQAALQIGHVRGVILLAARQRGAAIHEYTAPEVKMAVVRQGAAVKHQVEFMVRRILSVVGAMREDEADALAVALCHAHRSPSRGRIVAVGSASRRRTAAAWRAIVLR